MKMSQALQKVKNVLLIVKITPQQMRWRKSRIFSISKISMTWLETLDSQNAMAFLMDLQDRFTKF